MTPADNLARKAIVIPASQAPEEIKLRVAAYCRVSSDSEDQRNSFAAQNAYYTEFITSKENWTLVDIYADEGITGTSAQKRPDFQRMLADCRKGRIDKVLAKSISRFARNTKDCLEITRELKALGISVVFEEQNIDTSVVSGEMLTAIFAACAQAESESISKNMRWSYQKRMQSGTFIPPYLPYGYIRSGDSIVLEPDQAKVVQRIFRKYLSGISTEDIAKMLREERVPCKNGKCAWDSTSIRYILTNEKYTGDSIWQKYYTTNTLPFRNIKNDGSMDSYFASDTHPAIISEEEFRQANCLLQSRAQRVIRRRVPNAPYREKLICGCCGSFFRRKIDKGITYWVCIGRDKKRTENCGITQIPEAQITQAFLRCYYQLKHEGQSVLTELQDNLFTIRSRQMLWHPDIIELNKQISNLTSQSHMLTVLNQQGAVDPDIFISQSNQLAQQLRKAKRQKETLLEQDGNDTLSKTRELLEILAYGPEYLEAFDGELFRELVDKIIVESNERIRFRLINGLELPEEIERTVR